MNQEYIEAQVVSLTRKIHPQDLGEETSKLENILRQALTAQREAGAREERERCVAEMKIHKQNKKFITINGTLQMMGMIELIETGALTPPTK